MFNRIKFIADAGQVARSVAITVVAIALAVYAMLIHASRAGMVVLGGVILILSAGALLQVSRAVRHLRQQHDQTRDTALRAERHYLKVLRRLLATLENRQAFTQGRSKRIGMLCRRLAERVGLDPRQSRLLYLAAQLHDIGLLAVPDHILEKPARLGGDEFRAIRRHPEVAYRILEPLTSIAEILPAVRYHHERMNGTGYPYGLAGEAIPLPARILAVADAFDAMTHDRPHRTALTQAQAVGELRRCCPAGYDPQCVAALEALLHVEPEPAVTPARAPASARPLQVSTSG